MSSEQLTPVAFFAYRRPHHAQASLARLARCVDLERCRLFLFADGPQGQEDLAAVQETRRTLGRWANALGAELREQDLHLGLAKAIVTGVSEICSTFGEVVVLEDDLLVRPEFLRYMRLALDRYRAEPAVYQIAGHAYRVRHPGERDADFLPVVSTHGWATWQRAWRAFSWGVSGSTELTDRKALRRFDLDGTYPFSRLLGDRLAGRNDSWGVLWYWAVFSRGGLVLWPRRSLVWNAGYDGSGTHCGSQPDVGVPSAIDVFGPPPQAGFRFPDEVTLDRPALQRVTRVLRREGRRRAPPLPVRVVHRAARWFGRAG